MTQCSNCQSTNTCKDGRTVKGKQRYRCKDCNKRFVLDPSPGRPKVVDPDQRKADRAEYMRKYRRQKKDENP